MQVKVKKLNSSAIVPQYAKAGDTGLDLVAITKKEHGDLIEYGTGLAIEIPTGYVGLLFPRSSIKNYTLSLTNHVGVIDSNYRGEIKVFFRKELGVDQTHYNTLDRICQLVLIQYPQITLQLVDELSSTERGDSGFGSSGK